MGNQWGLRLHLILLSLLTTYTSLGSSHNNNTVGRCSEQERLALINLKHSIKDNSRIMSSWVGTDCCQWEGVLCDDVTGSVVSLYLKRGNGKLSFSYGNSVVYPFASAKEYSEVIEHYHMVAEAYYHSVGEAFNSSLTDLRHLRYLDFSGNDFQGRRIPDFIGSLKQLRYLNLSNAGFGGAIPNQIGNLSNLKVLDLNSLSETQELMTNDVSWISRLSLLEHLDLSGVDLTGALNRDMVLYMIPSSLRELSLSSCGLSNARVSGSQLNLSRPLPNIRRLDLSWNNYEGRFVSVLTNMSSLISLDLSYNNFRQIEDIGIWRQCHLKELFVSNNQLEEEMVGPSTNTSQCSDYALEMLDLSKNGLNGLIPASLGKMTRLRDLDLTSNRLKGPIPESLGRLRLLEVLYLSDNQLNGSIPEFIGRLEALTDLCLDLNHLTGPIPSIVGRLASLQSFIVSSNFLNGSIPVSIGQLTKLEALGVSNNSLEGVVFEAHFANHTMLKSLDMSSNRNLTFCVPREWIPPFQLEIIRLRSCKILDEFPHWLQTQNRIHELVLSNTGISGPLPVWLRKKHITFLLDLSHNKLRGPLTNLPSMASEDTYGLFLQNNFFNGSIPRSLCRWVGLWFLNLSRNRLMGKIPNCLQNLPYLYIMMLGSNRLSGVLSSSLGHISSLSSLNLNDNNFIGELPRDLGKLSALEELDLGDNRFSGKIPEWIGQSLASLMVLRLHKNNFTGRIPHSLCKNSDLQILDVAHNYLTGSIPHCFGKLNGMAVVKANHQSVLVGTNTGEENMIHQVMKGVDLEYTKNMDLVFNMDLSSNKLTGEIPEELTALCLLLGLNLSHNHLTGRIPNGIGNMKSLTSLDFSVNELTGMIPPSMAALNFLSHLNLSNNNLFGQIPTGNQLQTLTDPSIYAGNKDLCDAPLLKNCSNQEDPTTRGNDKYGENVEPKKVWFYFDIICGFATGFWGVIGILLFMKRLRHKLFTFAEVAMDKIHVAVKVRVSRLMKGR